MTDDAPNAGLVFEKLPVASGSWTASGLFDEQQRNEVTLDWLDRCIRSCTANKSAGKGLIKRRKAMLRCLGNDAYGKTFVMVQRLQIGTGITSPMEFGMQWHPTIGLPYIPGSSVKGVMREWACWCGVSPEQIGFLFGPEGDEREEAAGCLVVHDALPEKINVTKDVMTPHYHRYLDSGAEDTCWPADFYSPDMHTFLVVGKTGKFHFALTLRGAAMAMAEEDRKDLLEQGRLLLTGALRYLGAGAKTARGYGRAEEERS